MRSDEVFSVENLDKAVDVKFYLNEANVVEVSFTIEGEEYKWYYSSYGHLLNCLYQHAKTTLN